MPTKTTIMMAIATSIIIITAATITPVTTVITTITVPLSNDLSPTPASHQVCSRRSEYE
jgi:hypothetical protein